jgi:hypothetical protein
MKPRSDSWIPGVTLSRRGGPRLNARAARWLVVGVTALVLSSRALAGDSGPPPGSDSPAWDGETFRHIVDDATGTAFDVPTLGFRVETRHFDRKTPAFRIKDSFAVSGPGGLEVTIDVFENTEGLDLGGFFDAHLAFMRSGMAGVRDGMAGARKVPAILVDQPKVEGAYAQPSAIFALGTHVFRVMCANGDDARAAKVYLRVLSSIDLGKAAR